MQLFNAVATKMSVGQVTRRGMSATSAFVRPDVRGGVAKPGYLVVSLVLCVCGVRVFLALTC